MSLIFNASSSLERSPDAAARRISVEYCSRRASPNPSMLRMRLAICSACAHENETFRRICIFIVDKELRESFLEESSVLSINSLFDADSSARVNDFETGAHEI